MYCVDAGIYVDDNWNMQNADINQQNYILSMYTDTFDEIINTQLRSKNNVTGLVYDIINSITNNLQSAIPYPDDLCFNRGISGDYVTKYIKPLQINDIIELNGFNSLSTTKGEAYRFTIGKENPIMLSVCLPTGSKFIDVTDSSHHFEECEILTRPNLVLQLTDIYEDNLSGRYKNDTATFYKFKALNSDEPYYYNGSVNEDFDYKFMYFFKKLLEYKPNTFPGLVYYWPKLYKQLYSNQDKLDKLLASWNYKPDEFAKMLSNDIGPYNMLDTLRFYFMELMHEFDPSYAKNLEQVYQQTNIDPEKDEGDRSYKLYDSEHYPNALPNSYFKFDDPHNKGRFPSEYSLPKLYDYCDLSETCKLNTSIQLENFYKLLTIYRLPIEELARFIQGYKKHKHVLQNIDLNEFYINIIANCGIDAYNLIPAEDITPLLIEQVILNFYGEDLTKIDMTAPQKLLYQLLHY